MVPLLLATSLTLGACSSNDDGGGPMAAAGGGDTTATNADGMGTTDVSMGTDGDADTDGGTTGVDTGNGTDTDGGTTGADTGNSTDTDAGDTAGTDTDGGATTGTSSDGGDTTGGSDASGSYAFVAAAQGGAGQIERISFADGFTINGNYPAATSSDFRVDTDGTAIYQVGRFQLDSLTKFSATDTSVVDYQFSVNGDETAINPHDVVFVNETKAYVLRYGSPTIWIINPSATTEAEFKTGEIDLSAYDPDLSDADLSPNPTSGVIIDDKLFVVMQRLSEFKPIETGYVAVFDTATDLEIDTGKGEIDSLKGIPLGTLNPTNIRYNSITDQLYVTGRGNIFVQFNSLPGDSFSGGLFAIDDSNYDVIQVLDDGDMNNNNGFIERTLVISDEKGYVTLYASEAPTDGSSRNVLYTFNPSTGVIGNPVAGITDSIASINLGTDGNVWVGVNNDATPGFIRLNPADDMFVEPFIQTSLNPLNVVFVDVP